MKELDKSSGFIPLHNHNPEDSIGEVKFEGKLTSMELVTDLSSDIDESRVGTFEKRMVNGCQCVEFIPNQEEFWKNFVNIGGVHGKWKEQEHTPDEFERLMEGKTIPFPDDEFIHYGKGCDITHNQPSEKQQKIDRTRLRQAAEEAKLSTCVKWQVGCLITDTEGRIVATGYNGTPHGHKNCCDEYEDLVKLLERTKDDATIHHADQRAIDQNMLDHREWSAKHEIHAEMNAILHSDRSDRLGGTLYVTLQPCPQCAKMICASGVKRVVFGELYHRADSLDEAGVLFAKSGIEVLFYPNTI